MRAEQCVQKKAARKLAAFLLRYMRWLRGLWLLLHAFFTRMTHGSLLLVPELRF